MLANDILGVSLLGLAILGLVVLLNSPRQVANRLLTAFIASSGLWVAANLLANLATTNTTALLWSRLTLVPAALIGYSFLFFTYNFPKKIMHSRSLWRWFLIPVILFSLLTFTDYNAVSITAGKNNLVVGSLYYGFIAFFGICAFQGFINLFRAYRAASGKAKMQVVYLFAGLVLAFVPGVLVDGLGLMLGNYQFLAVIPSVALVFVVFSSIAIIRHRLLNIRAVVARSVAYVFLLLTLGALYGFSLFIASSFFFPNQSIGLMQEVYYTGVALVLAFTLQPLRRFFERQTDRIFFRDHYDSQEVLSLLGKTLVNEFILERLLAKTLHDLCQQLHIEGGQLYIFNNANIYKIEHYGPLPTKLMTVPHLDRLHRNVLVADELEPGRTQEILSEYGVRVMMKLRTREEFVGYLLLGNKLSGDVYSSQDIALLEIFVQELAVAISNAKAYEDIAEFNVTLQQKIDVATKRLTVANRNLKELDEAKDEFISMASHQLRTPLTSIKGYLSMVLEGDTGKITAQQSEFLTYAFTGAQRTVNMIADLLNVSRMTAGKFFIEKSDVDLTKLVSEEVQQLQQMAESRQLTLKLVPPKKAIPTMQLDEGKTRQVVMNFVDNALHYTKKGEVVVSLQIVGKRVELRVKDSGIGVPKAAKEHLFSKFFRADNAQTARPDDTGLGLFLAKRVIEDQGGTIIFESVEGKGSTFGFSMPLTSEDSGGTHK